MRYDFLFVEGPWSRHQRLLRLARGCRQGDPARHLASLPETMFTLPARARLAVGTIPG